MVRYGQQAACVMACQQSVVLLRLFVTFIMYYFITIHGPVSVVFMFAVSLFVSLPSVTTSGSHFVS